MKTMGSAILLSLLAGTAAAQQVDWPSPRLARPKMDVIGPYDAVFIAGADTIARPAQGYAEGETLPASPQWTLSAWIRPARITAGRAIVGGIGPAAGPRSRALALVDGRAALLVGDTLVRGGPVLAAGRWHHLIAIGDGDRIRLLLDGREVAAGRAAIEPAPALVTIGPRLPGLPFFTGHVAALTFTPKVPTPAEIATAARAIPDEALIRFEDASPTWPLTVRNQYGEAVPQRAWTLPTGNAPFSPPRAIPVPSAAALVPAGGGRFSVNGWRMAEGPTVAAGGPALSTPGFDAARWHVATVPGTALTTLVDRGVYPDPGIGLNNMAIPERLARQDYWYRTEFVPPADLAGKRLTLRFDGINYAAEIWVNGTAAGTIKGAFIRGAFDVTDMLVPGRSNAVAVRVSPPPHPGIPHEQSMTAGRGENGGAMMIDGPTFTASEGWDWIPAVRDRNTGLWQGVELVATGTLTLGDPQVVTTLPNGDTSVADVAIAVPVTNHGPVPLDTTIRATFDDVTVTRAVRVPPAATVTVALTPASHPALRVANPRLWWPNGYGDPTLHDLHLGITGPNGLSDEARVRFGMRQVTYELSSLDSHGDLRRIEVDLARARHLGTPVIDERHAGLRKVPGGWANSLFPGAERSPAVRTITGDEGLSPHLVLRVNGVRIAGRGGNWGMDDMRKRVGHDRLDPYFRLHRDAGMNIIRNWMGQSTEASFYDLADRYGIMILNDFWESTQDNNAEAEDVPLFLANARDTVRRFRNHPSIVMWIGRNEGVPQPILQTALQDMVWAEDGTRMYKGNSRIINFAGSGPYNWREPAGYFTDFARGFAVEVGTYSFPTLEAWQRAVPAADRWPINDTWAYHDWHQERAVAVTSFMDAMATRFGPATDLADFERKAQMLNYESHRAIFEGMNAGLWKTNSARMLWMSHPAWPSTDFQIYSSDYDTHGSFYGTRKGAEPVHVQMNLPDRRVVMVNTTRTPLTGVLVRARIVGLDNREWSVKERRIDVPANGIVDAFLLDPAAAGTAPVLVRLEAERTDGTRLSDNFYWDAASPAALRALVAMPAGMVTARATPGMAGDERSITIDLANTGRVAVLQTKLTLFDTAGQQILPAYFTDNYVSLLPGETRQVSVRYSAARGPARVRLRGWNLAPADVP
ncbi:glycosyl hydrolase [Sphingomonas sp. Leaf407]|uniref:glycoside hydrolase family 2 n=1 Tax=unclassified Sphingomonas TaxID=196159 RepID=UPI0006F7AC24|nr:MULTISPECIES: glycoside hydrolase family 2 [unclassified Sphingomonas]KQN39294.1 glycosyl hydrolase [Sphingomonas sp. Leaf42]KQT28570.1 glycosyl hydrolase [Sphingomonas sp. Leaf407]